MELAQLQKIYGLTDVSLLVFGRSENNSF